MIGKNPLWVARQHGHSVRTMLEIYAAWAEGAVESDIAVIEAAMGYSPDVEARVPTLLSGLRRLFQRRAPTDVQMESARRSSAPGVLSGIRRLITRSEPLDIRVKRPTVSIWHWICHQKPGRCS